MTQEVAATGRPAALNRSVAQSGVSACTRGRWAQTRGAGLPGQLSPLPSLCCKDRSGQPEDLGVEEARRSFLINTRDNCKTKAQVKGMA